MRRTSGHVRTSPAAIYKTQNNICSRVYSMLLRNLYMEDLGYVRQKILNLYLVNFKESYLVNFEESRSEKPQS